MTERATATTTRPTREQRAAATRLRIGIGAFRRRAHETKADGEVSGPELTALSRLERHGPATTAQLARQEQITPQAMGATVTGLVERGLVERRADETDRRLSIVSITPGGRQVIRAGRSALVDRIAAALAQDFTADEVATLDAAARLLERLADRL